MQWIFYLYKGGLKIFLGRVTLLYIDRHRQAVRLISYPTNIFILVLGLTIGGKLDGAGYMTRAGTGFVIKTLITATVRKLGYMDIK